MNISKKEVSKTLKKFKGTAWDQSPLFKKLYEEEFGMPGGQPFGCLMGDYYFDHSAPDVELLAGIAQISAAAHAPFLTAAAPSLLNMDTWQELSNPAIPPNLWHPGTPPGNPPRIRIRGIGLRAARARGCLRGQDNPVDEFAFGGIPRAPRHTKYVVDQCRPPAQPNNHPPSKLYGWCAPCRAPSSVAWWKAARRVSDDGGRR
jgi:type VI secretion system protein ImpC